MNVITRIIAALRYPESTLGKTLHRVFPVLLLILLLMVGFSWFATYRTVMPERLAETIDPSSFLLRNFSSVQFLTSDRNSLEGWFIPSIRGAPVIFLCHGFKSNRAELLTLASTFQENGYHLFLFDFRGHGNSRISLSSLGIMETRDLLSAIETITARPEVDPNRVGAWGVSLGAYVALSAATLSNKIQTLVVDSPFESPDQFVEMQTPGALGIDYWVFQKLSVLGFRLLNLRDHPGKGTLRSSLSMLSGKDKLFITSEEPNGLESQTLNLFNLSPQPKELLRVKYSRTAMLYDIDRKSYENSVLEFFKKYLPLRRQHP
jgi:pimeloyl-ACP methyl ester carboxylesterase